MTNTEKRFIAIATLEYQLKEITEQNDQYWTDRYYEKAVGMASAYETVEVITTDEYNFFVDIAIEAMIKTLKKI